MRPSVGRPPAADEPTTHRLWAAYQARIGEGSSHRLAPADYLALHRETGAPLRTIWALAKAWEIGDAAADPPAAEA